MIHKRILNPDRIRRIGKGFCFITVKGPPPLTDL
jgi:hypothetical protein